MNIYEYFLYIYKANNILITKQKKVNKVQIFYMRHEVFYNRQKVVCIMVFYLYFLYFTVNKLSYLSCIYRPFHAYFFWSKPLN